jgi:hypothetical protein
MSRTRKDSQQGTVIEVIKREDGTFDLFLNRRLDHERIHADGLVDVLCVRFGYCADEFDAILYELNKNGRAERNSN